MHITRIGLTPVKGGRHTEQPSVDLTLEGPVGDRVFCLVDRDRGRVLRTVENPTLVQSHLGEGPRRRPRYEVVETFPVGRSPR